MCVPIWNSHYHLTEIKTIRESIIFSNDTSIGNLTSSSLPFLLIFVTPPFSLLISYSCKYPKENCLDKIGEELSKNNKLLHICQSLINTNFLNIFILHSKPWLPFACIAFFHLAQVFEDALFPMRPSLIQQQQRFNICLHSVRSESFHSCTQSLVLGCAHVSGGLKTGKP